MPKICAVVLAAGSSLRMGGNKLLMALGGKPLVRRAVEAAAASRAKPIVVVTGNSAEMVVAALDGMTVDFVENTDFAKGLSTSLKCGVRALPLACDGAVVLLGDMPFVTSQLIDGLIAAFDPAAGRAICVPTFQGRRGNPVLWSSQFFPEMLALEGDAGAKRLMARHENLIHEVVATDDAPLIDIDTPEALATYRCR